MQGKERIRKVTELAAKAGRFLVRRKRWGIALVVLGPLLFTGSIELFALNLIGLGVGALILRNQLARRNAQRQHQAWLQRRAEWEEWKYQRWLNRRKQEANQSPG